MAAPPPPPAASDNQAAAAQGKPGGLQASDIDQLCVDTIRTLAMDAVQATTGPLGQGFANGVGMAMAERYRRERYGAEVCDHRVFAICSDGDLMEGVSAEAASLAGHLGLGRLVYVYDDNSITIDGDTALSFDGEDVDARFRSYGWQVDCVEDVNDLHALLHALGGA